jgi:hypothetical protein
MNLVWEASNMDQSFSENNFTEVQTETLLYHSSFHYRVSTYLSGMKSLLYLYLLPAQRLIAVFILLNDGKVFTSPRAGKEQHVGCKSGIFVIGRTKNWVWRYLKVNNDRGKQRK